MNELDVLAYADGLLDGDPAHKAAVEQALRSDPAALARAEAFRAQTEALRTVYAGRLSEPVPDRLHAALEAPRIRTTSGWLQSAAIIGLLVIAAAGGWMLGDSSDGTGRSEQEMQRLADGIRAQFVDGRPGSTVRGVVAASARPGPFDWLSDEISIRLKAPDLSSEGFALVETQAVSIGDERLVRLDYRGLEDQSFSLFLAPRWKPRSEGITEAERDDVSMAHWVDGPLASTMIARMPASDMRPLAGAVRSAIRANGERPVIVEPVPTGNAPVQAGVMADGQISPALSISGPGGAPSGGLVRPN